MPGRFPAELGLPLLRESRVNHLGKLAFQWIYWHVLLPGRDIPGIGPAMPTRGQAQLVPPRLRGDDHDDDPDRRRPGRR